MQLVPVPPPFDYWDAVVVDSVQLGLYLGASKQCVQATEKICLSSARAKKKRFITSTKCDVSILGV